MNQNFVRNLFVAASSLLFAAAVFAGCSAQNANPFRMAGFAKQDGQPETGGLQGAQSQGEQAAEMHPGLLDPQQAQFETPDDFKAKVSTTKGDFVLHVRKAWAPNGAGQFYTLAKIGYYKDIAIFRAIDGFMFQFGIHGDPKVAAVWSEMNIKDDPFVGNSNVPNTISYAQLGSPNSRSVQMFINLGNNAALDTQKPPFVPFGSVVEGKDVIGKINTEYGENRGNVQGNLKTQGNAYIIRKFPNIDFIRSVTIIEENGQPVGEAAAGETAAASGANGG